jgi:hypothetical protein
VRLTLDHLTVGHRVVFGGKGWVVREAPTPDGPHLRVRLVCPWRGGERTSFHDVPTSTVIMDTPSMWDGPIPGARP